MTPTGFAARISCALGDASYSIYLVQFFTLAVIARGIHLAFQGDAPNLIFCAGLGGTVLAGYVCHIRLERMLQRLARPWMGAATLSANRPCAPDPPPRMP
jgi:peptidoglycan/LPS O-acetylase OafA/YrhL